MSRAGDVQLFSGHPCPLGDGKSERGIAGTVAIGDRNSEGVYSWDSAEGRDKLEYYGFIGGGCCGFDS